MNRIITDRVISTCLTRRLEVVTATDSKREKGAANERTALERALEKALMVRSNRHIEEG